MPEKKLCPFRKTGVHGPDGGEEFAPCVEEKCAMWQKERIEVQHGEIGFHEYTIPAHCGLAGKP